MWKNGLWFETQIGTTKAATYLETLETQCPNCGEKISRESLWDASPKGHSALGIVTVHLHCSECSEGFEMFIYDGVFLGMATVQPQRGPRVGQYVNQWAAGAHWNVEHQRFMTYEEQYGTSEDDEIPF